MINLTQEINDVELIAMDAMDAMVVSIAINESDYLNFIAMDAMVAPQGPWGTTMQAMSLAMIVY